MVARTCHWMDTWSRRHLAWSRRNKVRFPCVFSTKFQFIPIHSNSNLFILFLQILNLHDIFLIRHGALHVSCMFHFEIRTPCGQGLYPGSSLVRGDLRWNCVFLGKHRNGLHESQKDCRPICKLRDLRVKLDKVTATDSTVNGQIFRCLPGPSDPSATAAQALASYAMTIAIGKPNYCRVATAFVATASCQHFLSSFLNIFNNSRKNLVLHVLVLICVGCIQ